jgi:cbb3-type cytochrome oxidase maturation protein
VTNASSGGPQMLSFFFLIPVCIGLGFVGLVAFVWSLENGQYQDLDGAAERILLEDENIRGDDLK